jgi:hypothetical protein
VVFLHGKIVYEGDYRSDCDSELAFQIEDESTSYDYYASSYSNYITEESCNNNDPLGNDTKLYRNDDGTWNIDAKTGEWSHVPIKTFVPGNSTPIFTQAMLDKYMNDWGMRFGWMLANYGQDCCGNPYAFDSVIHDETGMHLGTNESGSLVWFTPKKANAKWWRFAGQVATASELPDITKLSEWQVVNEYGEPQFSGKAQWVDTPEVQVGSYVGDNTYWTMVWEMLWELYFPDRSAKEFNWDEIWDLMVSDFGGDPNLPVHDQDFWDTMQENFGITKPILKEVVDSGLHETDIPCGLHEYDVIVVGGSEGDEGYWDGIPYYLKDGQWIKHKGTYGEMIMKYPSACIIHESTAGITSEVVDGKCVKKPDAWIGNAARIDACGDLAIVNANVKELDRYLIYKGKLLVTERRLGHKSKIEMKDSVSCTVSKYYGKEVPLSDRCAAADGISFAKFTCADGSTRHVVAYYCDEGEIYIKEPDTSIAEEKTYTSDWTVPPNEPVWEGEMTSKRPNCWWLVLGRRMPDGMEERKIFYKGMEVAYYIYDPANYPTVEEEANFDQIHYTGWRESLTTGNFAIFGMAYKCPRQSRTQPNERWAIWNEQGSQIVECSNVGVCPNTAAPWTIYQLKEDGTPKYETKTASWSYTETNRDYYSGAVTSVNEIEHIETVSYLEYYVVATGEILYGSANLVWEEFINGVSQYNSTKTWPYVESDRHRIGGGGGFSPNNCYSPEGASYYYDGFRIDCVNYAPPFSKSIYAIADWSYSCGTYDSPPKIIDWVDVVDNDLPDDYYPDYDEYSEVSFDTTFVGLYGSVASIERDVQPTAST